MASPNPDFIITPCIPADIPQMISVYSRAFANDYLSNFAFPPSIPQTIKHNWLYQRFLKTMSQPEIRNFKVMDASTGTMAAWVRWQFPYKSSEEEKVERGREAEENERRRKEGTWSEWPQGANLEVCDEKFGGLERMKIEHVDHEDVYMIHLLATDPAYQRKGLAKMLLKHGLDLADSERRKAYIQATAAGYPVYLKLGFREIAVLSIDLSKWGGGEPGINRIMIRDPQQ